jgi:hypothetical protein
MLPASVVYALDALPSHETSLYQRVRVAFQLAQELLRLTCQADFVLRPGQILPTSLFVSLTASTLELVRPISASPSVTPNISSEHWNIVLLAPELLQDCLASQSEASLVYRSVTLAVAVLIAAAALPCSFGICAVWRCHFPIAETGISF